jgi:hypothetical protein
MKNHDSRPIIKNYYRGIMSISEYTIKQFILSTWYDHSSQSLNNSPLSKIQSWDLLLPLRQWIDRFEVKNASLAHRLCHVIPAQCPFARTLHFRDRVLLTIPPLCKVNPLYEELMSLRFRALCYLADNCGEDISQYC